MTAPRGPKIKVNVVSQLSCKLRMEDTHGRYSKFGFFIIIRRSVTSMAKYIWDCHEAAFGAFLLHWFF